MRGWMLVGLLALSGMCGGAAALEKGQPLPNIQGQDVFGKPVDLATIIDEGRDLVILFFFSPSTGEEMALRLKTLDLQYGRSALEIIALGMREDAEALKRFAANLGIGYFVLDGQALEDADWIAAIDLLPSTVFVVANRERTVERVIRGGGASMAQLLTHVAENFFQQRKLEQAEALLHGEESREARELMGFIFTEQGKLDDAAREFGELDSSAGLAAVALQRGDIDEALALAAEAPEGHAVARVVESRARLQLGAPAEGLEPIADPAALDGPDWAKSEAYTLRGRLEQEVRGPDTALPDYEQAIALDPYNVVALSNEAAAHQERYEDSRDPAHLEQARAALERASELREDPMVAMLLRQVVEEQARATDLQRRELIQEQVRELTARMERLREEGAPAGDAWSTRPLVLALLPSGQGGVFFERAGTEAALRRELEAQLARSGSVAVVEREMLDALLQELNLGSSELADPATQRQLGRLLSAGNLAFLSFSQLGAEPTLYLRLVDTETSEITFQTSHPVKAAELAALTNSVSGELLAHLTSERTLQGLVADASDPDSVMINLGQRHGVEVGQQFVALDQGEPIEVGGRVIAHRQRPVGTLRVVSVETEYALCTVERLDEGAELRPEMKLRAAP